MTQQLFVLVVEDDDLLRSIIARNLRAAKYMVFEAPTFRTAIDEMSIKPNLMILDINLPDATGWDVAEWLEEHMSGVPIIVISGAVKPTPAQMKKYRASAFLPKPFGMEQLLSLIEQYAPTITNS
jgi:DNA-binding response OmpR family regulator